MTKTTLTCEKCGAIKTVSGVPCPECAALGESITVQLEGVAADPQVGSFGLVTQQGEPSSASYWLRVQTPSGTRSEARLNDGLVTLAVQGASDVGRRGEPHALHIFLEVLRGQGLSPRIIDGRDGHGEDALLLESQHEFTVQLTTIPSVEEFWREAAVGAASIVVKAEVASEWIRRSLLAKLQDTSPVERPFTLLVLDARLAGVVGNIEVVTAYLAKYPDPASEFNLAGTWLLGPTASTSTQLGSSRLFPGAAT